jgi:hypothetical protein
VKRSAREAISRRMKEHWARLRGGDPGKFAVAIAKLHGKELSGKQVSVDATSVTNALGKEPEEPGSPAQLAYVSEIPLNPRMVFARNDVCERFEVLVGRNSVLWVDCPIEIKASLDFPGYYEFVGELPHGRWDKAYALRFQ